MNKNICLLIVAALFICSCKEKSRWKGCGFEDGAGERKTKIVALDGGFADDNTTYTIPVIFHVVYWNEDENIPYAKFQQELSDLNRDFLLKNADVSEVYPAYRSRIGNANINFVFADTLFPGSNERGVKRVERTSSGRLYRSSPVINPGKYLNVFIGRINSDGYVPSATAWEDPETDGIYLYYEWIGGSYRLLTHEAGHWLGLYHIFDGGCSQENDGIDDTPPQRGSWEMDWGCDPAKVHNRCQDKEFPMFNNYMDYSDCRKMFTRQQCTAMRQVLATHRASIIGK